jgi:hypothetical protein
LGKKRIRSKAPIMVWYPCPECFRMFPMMGEDNVIRHVMIDHPLSDLAYKVRLEMIKEANHGTDNR